jgi:hypothetical protein
MMSSSSTILQQALLIFAFLTLFHIEVVGFIHPGRFQTKKMPQISSIARYQRSISQDFMDSVFRQKPIINPLSSSKQPTQPTEPVLQEGGLLTSVELYATSPELQTFVISQISNWIRGESIKILPHGSYSVLFASIDGQRLIHMIGWRSSLNDQATENSFNEFRRRASLAADGLPLDLKESTHIYKPIYSIPEGISTSFAETALDKYPLFSIDLFTTRLKEDQTKVKDALNKAVKSVDGKLPDLVSMHLLASTDRLVHCIVSSWLALDGKDSLSSVEDYSGNILTAKKYAIEGSITDIVDKTKPSRLYTVADVYIP